MVPEDMVLETLKFSEMARLRVRGLSRVHFAVVCKVIACNIKRWWRASRPFGADNTPRSTGLPTPFDIFWMRLYSMLRGTNPKSEHIHVILQKVYSALKSAA